MSREVFIVAGLASKGANLAPLSLIAALHQDDNVHYINGARMTDDGLTASSPSDQRREIDEILGSTRNTEAVIYSQSIGALAAISCLENNLGGHMQVIAISPPLPDPLELLSHPRMVSRMRRVDGHMVIPSYSFALSDDGPSSFVPSPVDVRIDDAYRMDVAASAQGLLERVKRLTDAGLLKLVLPTHDWNTGARDAVSDYEGVVNIDGTHSLHSTQDAMAATALLIHGLSLTSTSVS